MLEDREGTAMKEPLTCVLADREGTAMEEALCVGRQRRKSHGGGLHLCVGRLRRDSHVALFSNGGPSLLAKSEGSHGGISLTHGGVKD